MASSQTSNYKLNQWAASDKFLRTEFNSDNSKIDAALKAISTLASKEPYITGQYSGNNGTNRQIELGITGKLALIFCQTEDYFYERCVITPLGALYWPEYGRSEYFYAAICCSGTKLVLGQSIYLNYTGRSYFYIVFG